MKTRASDKNRYMPLSPINKRNGKSNILHTFPWLFVDWFFGKFRNFKFYNLHNVSRLCRSAMVLLMLSQKMNWQTKRESEWNTRKICNQPIDRHRINKIKKPFLLNHRHFYWNAKCYGMLLPNCAICSLQRRQTMANQQVLRLIRIFFVFLLIFV